MQGMSQNNLKSQLDLVKTYITESSMQEITIVEYRTYSASEGTDYLEYFIFPKTKTKNTFEAFVKLYNCQLHFWWMAEDFWMAKVLTVDFIIDYFLKNIDEYCFDLKLFRSICIDER